MKLKKEEFLIHKIKGDGNCGPRAIGVGIYGKESMHKEVRQSVFNYMIEDYEKRVAKIKDKD